MTQGGQVYLAIESMKTLPREVYENGVRVETTQLQRAHPRLKSTTFIGTSDMERKHIAREGVFEMLLVKDGYILEGMTSNFFYVVRRDAHLHGLPSKPRAVPVSRIPPHISTALHDILLGVTRQTIIDVAQKLGLEVDYEPLKVDQIREVGEAFISSSSRGIVPVVQIDDVTIGQGKPGPITKQLSEAYQAYVMEKAETI